jgi:hypothetical protein
MAIFKAVSGIITTIETFRTGDTGQEGCYQMMSLQSPDGAIVNFIVSPSTYFVDHVTMYAGDGAIGFYDTTLPAPMIYPPQLQAAVMARAMTYRNIKMDYFNEKLISSDGMLKINLSPRTQVLLENNQKFTTNPINRYLVVIYGATTRSIPAQTSPDKIIVMCMQNRPESKI